MKMYTVLSGKFRLAGCVPTMDCEIDGQPQCARRVGKALAEVPPVLQLPCHGIVDSGGRIVPHWPEQRELLKREGVRFKKNGCVDLRNCLWEVEIS